MYVISVGENIIAVTENLDLADKVSDHPDMPKGKEIVKYCADLITDENFLGLYRVEFHTNGELFRDPILIRYVPNDYEYGLPRTREDKDHNLAIICLANSKEEALKTAIKDRDKYFSEILGLKTNNDDHFGIYRITFDKFGNMSDVGPILIKRVPEDYDFGVPKVSGDPEKHISVTCKANSNADAVYTAVVARTEYIKLYNHDALEIRYWSKE